MTPKPPRPPAETLARVMRIAKFEGSSVLVICGALALASAVMGDFAGALIGVLIAGAGAFELHGAGLLKAGEPRGVNWLVGSQLYLLATILGYVGWRLASYDPALVRQLLEPVLRTPEMRAKLSESGLTEVAMLEGVRQLYHAFFGAVAVGTLLYQGGMALYYHRRRAAVAAALAE
jgi:hypothetical protein